MPGLLTIGPRFGGALDDAAKMSGTHVFGKLSDDSFWKSWLQQKLPKTVSSVVRQGVYGELCVGLAVILYASLIVLLKLCRGSSHLVQHFIQGPAALNSLPASK